MSNERYESFLDTEHLKKDLRGRSVRGAALTLSARTLRAALQLGALAVLARLLTPDDYGLYGKVLAITSFLILLRNLGLAQATVQRDKINHQQVTNLFWVNAGVGTALTALTVLGAPILAMFYHDPLVTGVARGLAISVFFGSIRLQHFAILRRQMRFKATAAVDVISYFVGIVAGVTSALFGAGYWALIILNAVHQFVSAVGATIASGWLPGLPRRDPQTGSLLAFGGNLVGFNLLQYVAKNVDNVLIGRFVGNASLGYYSRAYQLLLFPVRLIFGPLAPVSVSMLSRAADDPARHRRAYLQLLDVLSLVTMPSVAILIATADWVVAIMLGDQWSRSAEIFAILGFAALFQTVSDTSDWLFTSLGKTNILLRFGFIRVGFIVGGIVAGLVFGGVIGVAWGVALSLIFLVMPLQLIVTGRYTPVSTWDMARTMLPPALLAFVIIGAIKLLRIAVPEITHPWIGMLLAIATAAVVSGLAFLLVKPLRSSMSDLFRLRTALLNRSKKAGNQSRQDKQKGDDAER